ncbi:phosphopantetheine-binding protein [Nocardia barduliensis]|uniref:phosphopantetheine-binding protein n=1 Tax=Nocardia barduliensis TaxID=2736643 RepID=UPI0015724FDD|nr:phosphopantetheine-binding protein [Nocardia barduliensis]
MSLRPVGQPPTLAEVRATVATVLQTPPSDIPDDADLLDLGLDSLGMMRVVNLWRRAGIRMALDDLTAEPTLSAWSRHTRPEAHNPL